MNAEKKRNAELQKREKQLKAQIDNLITDSLGLLKTRLKELGIQAKTPPEFIEKAKGIVSSHHELQKNKLSLEREIRQLEAERDTLIASKEQELIEKYTKERKDLHPSKIREYVKRELEATTNGMGMSSAVAPLLNKLSDVTFTKCSSSAAMVTSAVSGAGGANAPGTGAVGAAGSSSISEQITTQIRKRPREQIHKQRDWPEKRAKTGSAADWPSSSTISMAKIEENNPEALAKKILEQGRSLEKSSHHRTSAATLTISPTKGSNHKSSFPPHHLGAPGVEVRKIEPPSSSPPPPVSSASSFHRHPAKHGGGVHIQPPPPNAPAHPTSRSAGLVVDLPKIDISMSMGAATTSTSITPSGGGMGNGPPLPQQQQPPLVLPAHPDSRSQSSDHTDDLTFAKSKMSATPRAEQFEDRLKSIIHSVLSSDAPDGGNHHPKPRGPPPAAHSSHLPSPVPPPPQAQPHQPAPPPPPPPPAPPAAHSRMLPSPSSSSSQQPMFSPVKRELPMHLPPPPSTHAHPGGPGGPPRFHHASAAARPPPQPAVPAPPPPPAAHHYPPVSSPYAPAPPTSSPYAPPAPPPPPSHAHHMKLPPRSSPSQHHHHHHHQPQPQPPPPHPHQQHHHHRQSPSSHRTMGDLIAGELERNLPPPQQHIPSSQQSRHHPPPPSPPAHSRSSRPYVEPAGIPGNPREYLPRAEPAPTMLRMSQVIEDSIRGHVKASELEGLACPRTRSPERERERERLPPSVSVSSASSSSLRPPSSRADYPAMEGLAARFGPYMESVTKRDRLDHQIPPPPPTSTTSSQHRTLPSGSRGGLPPPPPPPVSSPMSFHDARRPPSASHSNRPPQPSALPSPPVLPPKKQHLDDHPDYRLPKGTVFQSITFAWLCLV